MKTILFVCTGNTCRSTMAKGLLENAVSRDRTLYNKIKVDSSGIYAIPDDCASPNSIAALMDEYGIDISSHRAKRFCYEIGQNVDIILAMTHSHKYAICENFPDLCAKTFTLKEYVKRMDKEPGSVTGMDISDPYGMSLDIYKLCAKEIKAAVDKLIKMLKAE